MPEVAPSSYAPNTGTPIGLTEVRDARSATSAGSAGLARFTASAGLLEYLRQAATSRLNSKNFNVVYVPPGGYKRSSELNFNTIRLTLASAETSTPDALLARGDAEVRLAVEVLNPTGRAVFQQHYSGSYLARLDFLSLNPMKAQGIMLAEASNAALDRAFGDPQFLKAIR